MRKLLAITAVTSAALMGLATASAGATPPTVGKVTNVRFGAHPTFDRMVIDITGPLPANLQCSKPYSLKYDPSGKSVALSGKANVQVVTYQANAHPGYVGPTKVNDLHMKYLHGFVKLGDFEATVSFGLTTDVTNPKVKCVKLTSPNRIVVDVWK